TIRNATFVDPLVSQYEFMIWIAYYTCVDMVLCVVGIIANVINITTFSAMGVDDGITVAFVFLSSSELLCCLAALGQKLAMAFWVVEMVTDYSTWFAIHPYVFNSFFGHTRHCIVAIPELITTYLAVVKCMCVTRPFTFPSFFTLNKTLWAMKAICVFSVASYVPLFACMGTADELDPAVNATRRMLWFAPYRDIVKVMVWSGRDAFLAFASQSIILISVVFMARALSEAAKLRERLRSGTYAEDVPEASRQSPTGARKSGGGALSAKELQIVKQIVLISVFYVIGTIPKMAVLLAYATVSEFTQGGVYQNVYIVASKGSESSELILSIVNIFIYYRYNSKFR
ncbi:unnamed protein product, partial [Lymnaea stagnalis]